MKKLFVVCAILCSGLFACGTTDGELKTSTVTATVDTSLLDSDVISWVDAAGAKATACAATSSPAIPAADSVNVTVTSKPYANTGAITSPIRIESATISYIPANSSTPPMASEYQIIGTTIANGGSASIPVRVVTQEQKRLTLTVLSSCLPAPPIYNYYTTITLNVLETGTDKKTTASASLQLRMHDYIDK
jgi:hypothetical protein